jgi:hypothetical protein
MKHVQMKVMNSTFLAQMNLERVSACADFVWSCLLIGSAGILPQTAASDVTSLCVSNYGIMPVILMSAGSAE